MFYGSLSVPFQAVDITASFYSEENTTFWSALGINLSTLPLIVYNLSVWDIPECVLKNNLFEHDKSVFKQLRGTAIGTKMAPPYAIIFMDSLEEDILSNSLLKPLVWWRYIDDIFIMWEHGEEELQKFLEN